MDKKFIGILRVTMIVVFIASYGCAMFYQSSQTANTANPPSPTPTPSPAPTPTPEPTLTPSPSEEPTEPASIPKPSVPEFTLEYVDYSYDVPPTTRSSTDPYTNETTTTTIPGHHVEKKKLYIKIKNQPFTPPNSLTRFYYDVRVKGHFGKIWTDLDPCDLESTSDYTIISFSLNDRAAGDQIDFQVEAVIATSHPSFPGSPFGTWSYEESGWSNTQTFTVP